MTKLICELWLRESFKMCSCPVHKQGDGKNCRDCKKPLYFWIYLHWSLFRFRAERCGQHKDAECANGGAPAPPTAVHLPLLSSRAVPVAPRGVWAPLRTGDKEEKTLLWHFESATRQLLKVLYIGKNSLYQCPLTIIREDKRPFFTSFVGSTFCWSVC